MTPWEAALGASVKAPTPEGAVMLKIPPGSTKGRTMRLKGKGIPGNPPGDMHAVLKIETPPAEHRQGEGNLPADGARAAVQSARRHGSVERCQQTPTQSVVILDDAEEITLADLSRACRVHAEWVMELVEEGVIEPRGTRRPAMALCRDDRGAREKARRLQNDLGINLPGVALALQLLDRIDALEARMRAASSRPDADDAD